MKYLLVIASLALATPAVASDLLYTQRDTKPSIASSGPYLAIKGGVVFPEDVDAHTSPTNGVTGGFDNGYDLGVALGYSFTSLGPVTPRLEAEVSYSKASLSTGQAFNASGPVGASFALNGDQTILTGWLNGYFDIPMGWGFTPFIGAGVGLSDINAKAQIAGFNVLDDSDTSLAWNLTAGMSYDINQRTSLELAYRYVDNTDVSLKGIGPITVNDDFISQQVNAGLRIKI